MPSDFIINVFICAVVVLCAGIIVVFLFRGKGNHASYRKKAQKIYKHLSGSDMAPGQVLSYLRKINPYVFEELVLDAFERKGYRAIRNKRYSGDGGLDGRVAMGGKTWYIQCKRYKGFVNAEHVASFARLCDESHMDGFFVHTGKTGRKSKINARYGDVEIISGNKLVELILNK